MLYKPDWEETKERYRAWWARENFGRCGLAVTAPLGSPPDTDEPAKPATPEERWTDLDYISALSDCRNSCTFFGGEAFPCWDRGFPGNKRLAVFLGAPLTLNFDTGWVSPVLVDDALDVSHLSIAEDNPYWQYTFKWLRRAAVDARGKCIPALGAFGGSGDTLEGLRGAERLLMDCLTQPDAVREAERKIMDLWFVAYELFYDAVKETAEGSTSWFALWSPGKFYAPQNDFSYNISTEMFTDIFFESIERQVNYLDHSVYHVDGVEAFRHVGALCELENLDAVQILPGAGKPSPLHYMGVLKQVQAAGKNLHIGIACDEVEAALGELSAQGLFIHTSCESEEHARRLLKDAEKWSHDRVLA